MLYLQVPAWSCSWDLNNSHHIYAGLQVWASSAFTSFLQPYCVLWTAFIFAASSCRMDHYGCLTCAKLREPWNPLMGYQATQYIQYTLFCKIQPSPLALELYCLLLPLACVSGTSVVLMKGEFLSLLFKLNMV